MRLNPPDVPGADERLPVQPHRTEGAGAIVAQRQRLGPREVLKAIGPGIIAGGADNDPAGVVTYSIVGAQRGFVQNWLLLLSTPMLIVVQQMSAKIGNVTKSDLGAVFRAHFGRKTATTAVLLSVIANILTIGADLLMMAAVAELITGLRFIYFIVPFAAFMTYISIFANYKAFSKYLLWLVGIFGTYIVAAFLAHPNWGVVLKATVIPHIDFSASYFVAAVGLLGTTITPYLFFWQTSGEVEERRGVQSMERTRLDIVAGMIWSNVTAFFIIVATGSVLFGHLSDIKTAADAAKALEPFAGSYAKYLFSVGVLGAGMLAIPVLAATTAYSVGSIFGWRRSLSRHVNNAPEFYIVLGSAILVGVQLAVSDVNPIRALFYSQVLDGLIAPVLVVLLLRLTSSRKVMGDFVNGTPTRVIGWVTVAVLVAADLALVYGVVTGGVPS